jgi:hypothetical protein
MANVVQELDLDLELYITSLCSFPMMNKAKIHK